MLTGVLIFAAFLGAKELNNKYNVVKSVQDTVYNWFGIKKKPVNKYIKNKDAETDNDSTRSRYNAFGEDLDDYGDDDDYLQHSMLDEEQKEVLKRIYHKKPRKIRKKGENKANRRMNNANENNRKRHIKHKHQMAGNESGSTEKIEKQKLRRRKKLGKCTREKTHTIRSNDRA